MRYKQNNSLQKHKRADTVKWAITWIVLLLMAAALVLGGLQLFSDHKPSDWFKKDEEQTEEVSDNVGMTVLPENEGASEDKNGSARISLKRAVVPVESYSTYDISPAAVEKAFTITASIEPADGEYKAIVWSCYFQDRDSAWATGKRCEDYVTFTEPVSSKGLSATVACKEAFGEPIVVSAQIQLDNGSMVEDSADCVFDYVKRPTVTLGHFDRTGGGRNFREAAQLAFLTDSNSVAVQVEYGVGTVQGELTFEGTGTLSLGESERSAVNSYMQQTGMTATFKDYSFEVAPTTGTTITVALPKNPSDYFLESPLNSQAVLYFNNGFVSAVGSQWNGSIRIPYNYKYSDWNLQGVAEGSADYLTTNLVTLAESVAFESEHQFF